MYILFHLDQREKTRYSACLNLVKCKDHPLKEGRKEGQSGTEGRKKGREGWKEGRKEGRTDRQKEGGKGGTERRKDLFPSFLFPRSFLTSSVKRIH